MKKTLTLIAIIFSLSVLAQKEKNTKNYSSFTTEPTLAGKPDTTQYKYIDSFDNGTYKIKWTGSRLSEKSIFVTKLEANAFYEQPKDTITPDNGFIATRIGLHIRRNENNAPLNIKTKDTVFDHYASFQKRPVITYCYKIVIEDKTGKEKKALTLTCDNELTVNDSCWAIQRLSEGYFDEFKLLQRQRRINELLSEILKYVKSDGTGVEPTNRKKFKQAVTNYQNYTKAK